MTDEENSKSNRNQQALSRFQLPLEKPHRPITRVVNRSEVLSELTKRKAALQNKQLFTMTLIATTTEGEPMETKLSDEQQFLIELIFKPNESGLKLRPAETQLLLSYIGEILREVEEEELRSLEDNNSKR